VTDETVNGPLIVLDGATKVYEVGEVDVHAWRSVNLTIEAGEFTAVVAASGSGKTTLLNVLGCLDLPREGTYHLKGRDITSMNDRQVSRLCGDGIGFVSQDYRLLNRFSALHNVEMPRYYRDRHDDDEIRLGGLFSNGQVFGRISRRRIRLRRSAMTMTDLRIGILGGHRGAYLASVAAEMDGVCIVAGCDQAPERLKAFARRFPDARLVSSYDNLLSIGLDAVILAGYCPDHGPQSIRALQSGAHVLSEVTAFHHPAEGVALVEAVESSGLIYMMAENCCFRTRALEARRLYGEGALGRFVHGECEYIHDIRPLMWQGDDKPHWRAWLPPFYYATHPVGEMLHILDARVSTAQGHLVGGLMDRSPNPIDAGGMTLRLDNGGLLRVMTSFASARDSQWLSIYGTEGFIESSRWGDRDLVGDRNEITVRLAGQKPSTDPEFYVPCAPDGNTVADRYGHGGADYYPIYHFIRAVREGVAPPVDVYRACDFTLPGIMGYRSALAGGAALPVPDFRDPATREMYRHDTGSPPRERALRTTHRPRAE